MELTPEERRKIYEEEKARIEAREQLERERQAPPPETTVSLAPNVAGLLCYLGWWITGLIFIIIEQKNSWIRFHAAQALVTFGSITVLGTVVNFIPWVGPPLSGITWFIGFVLWIILMIKAYNGERFKLGIFGDFAEKIAASGGIFAAAPESANEPSAQQPAAEPQPEGQDTGDTLAAPAALVEASDAEASDTSAPGVSRPTGIDERIDRKVKEYFQRKKTGYIVGSALTIAFSIIFLIVLNFFHEYIAYYDPQTINGDVVWVYTSFFTNEINDWLPIVTTTLILAIIGHIIIIVLYRPLLRKVVTFVLDIFGLATVISLLVIYPFDFSAIPNSAAASITGIVVTVVLIGISVGMAIGLIVRFIQMLVALARGTANQE